MAIEDLNVLRENALRPFCFPSPKDSIRITAGAAPVAIVPSKQREIAPKQEPLPKSNCHNLSARQRLAGRKKTNRQELTRLSALVHLHKLKSKDFVFQIIPSTNSEGKSNPFSLLAETSTLDWPLPDPPAQPAPQCCRIPKRLRTLLKGLEPSLIISLELFLFESLSQAPLDPCDLIHVSQTQNIKFIMKASNLTRFQRLLVHCICDFHGIFAQTIQTEDSVSTDFKDMVIYSTRDIVNDADESILASLYPNRSFVHSLPHSNFDPVNNTLTDLFQGVSL